MRTNIFSHSLVIELGAALGAEISCFWKNITRTNVLIKLNKFITLNHSFGLVCMHAPSFVDSWSLSNKVSTRQQLLNFQHQHVIKFIELFEILILHQHLMQGQAWVIMIWLIAHSPSAASFISPTAANFIGKLLFGKNIDFNNKVLKYTLVCNAVCTEL